MALISTEEVQVGMTLEKDVKNSHGQVLIRSGMELKERHLTLIRSWGVTEVVVRGEEKPKGEAIDVSPEAYAWAENSLKLRFSKAPLNDPVMQEIFRQSVMRKARTIPV
ncbi:hypothetical protein SAMN05444156_1919 [Verrucomicrobium sp. GAS474]|uniref:hypothetical protein n=1 Tax=Verrucomicrobium sp. GAS474 TaxID=1882831 RepID=UPI00087A942F|nr:hypothetical protein [Verrucomicrobium sp. GAS474]SDU09388.1 hypothetical protein SAMN05444156_1919 [Verrucomicrobium sp. GAS474]